MLCEYLSSAPTAIFLVAGVLYVPMKVDTSVDIDLAGLKFEKVDRLVVLVSRMPVRRRRFVFEYPKDQNGKRAAIRSGFSEKSAEQEAARLLRDVKVKEAVGILLGRTFKKCQIDAEAIVDELRCMAQARADDVIGADGKLKDFKDLSDDARRAIAGGFEIEMLGEKIVKIKFASKLPSNELLGKRLKMWTDKTELGGTVTLEELVAAQGAKQ